MSETNYIKSNQSVSKGAISFLLIVVLLTIGLFVGNMFLEKNISEIESDIAKSKNYIKELEKDSKLQAYSLVQANKKLLEKFSSDSKITKFINHFDFIEQKYGIKLEGFKLSNGILNSVVLVKPTEDAISYQITKNFISGYRVDEEALFNLNFINSIEGMDSMKFNISMGIK